jgi:hypothetical protein
MLETLHLLAQVLSKDPVTVHEVAHAVGTGKITTGEHKPITIEPKASDFQKIEIVRKGDTDVPSYVTLTPAGGKRLILDQLRAVYGDYRPLPRSNPDSPQRLMFRVKTPGMPYTCAIIADVDPEERVSGESRVTAITLRRDRALE